MQPGDAAAVIYSHSALTLRSRFPEHPVRRPTPGNVCPESTRHDGWLSRTFSCATSSVGTRHGGRRQSPGRECARSFRCGLVRRLVVFFTVARTGSPHCCRCLRAASPMDCQLALRRRGVSLSALAAAVSGMGERGSLLLRLQLVRAVATASLLLLAKAVREGKLGRRCAGRNVAGKAAR